MLQGILLGWDECDGKEATDFGQEFHISKQEENVHVIMDPESYS
jgi:hypothetical protein